MSAPRERERGAIIILTSIIALALLTFTAFSVDIGHESDVKRHLHLVADVASQDALYGLGTPTAFTDAVRLATSSAASNGHPLTGSNQLSVEIGQWTGTPPTFVPMTPTACQVSLPGGVAPACPAASSANAVRVIASNVLIWSFVTGSQGLSATSVARPEGFTGIEVGTYAAGAALNARQISILSAALGVSAVSFEGLAGANIKLKDLASQLGFASTDALLSETVTYAQLASAEARALSASGDSAAAASMTGIATALAASSRGSSPIPLGPLLGGSVASGGGSVLADNAGVDTLGLLTGALDTSVIDGNSFVSLNGLNLSIPNVGSVDAGVKVIQGPTSGYGFGCKVTDDAAGLLPNCAKSKSAQLEGQVLVHLTPITVPITGVGIPVGTVATVTPTIPLYFDSAAANAWVSYITCTSPFDHQANVDAWVRTGLAHLGFGQASSITTATNQTDLTAGASGSTQIPTPDGSTITVNAVGYTDISIPAIGFDAKVASNGQVALASSGPTLAQPSPSPTPAGPSYSGAFLAAVSGSPPLPSGTPGYRGPDTVVGATISPSAGITPTGNALSDGLKQLAFQLPDSATAFDTAVNNATGLGVGVAPILKAALDPALRTEASTLASVLTGLDQTVFGPLNSAFQAALGGATVTNLAVRDQTPPDGTICLPLVVK